MSNSTLRAYEAGVKLAQLNFMSKMAEGPLGDFSLPPLTTSSDYGSGFGFGGSTTSTTPAAPVAEQAPTPAATDTTRYYNPDFDMGRYVPGMPYNVNPPMQPQGFFDGLYDNIGNMVNSGVDSLRGLYDRYFQDNGSTDELFNTAPEGNMTPNSPGPFARPNDMTQSYVDGARGAATNAPQTPAPAEEIVMPTVYLDRPRAPAPQAPAPQAPAPQAPAPRAPAPSARRRAPAQRRPAGPSLNQVMAKLPPTNASAGTIMMLNNLRAARAGTAPKLRANPTMPNMRGMKMPEMIQMDPGAKYR